METLTQSGQEDALLSGIIESPRKWGRVALTTGPVATNIGGSMQRKRKALSERLWSRVDQSPGLGPNGDCHEWRGSLNPQGYGRTTIGSKTDGSRRNVLAHRLAWFVAHGEWPVENVLHRCDNPPCVRIDHLFEGTGADNTHDMLAKGREASGERNGRSKLTWAKIDLIRADSRPLRVVAKDFGVSNVAIFRIRSGQTWRSR